MKYIILIVLLLFSSHKHEKNYYAESFNEIKEEYSESIKQYVIKNYNRNIKDSLEINISNQLIPFNPVFFIEKEKELKTWDAFKDIDSIEEYLWEFGINEDALQYKSSEILIDGSFNKNVYVDSHLILFFSVKKNNLLLAELFWDHDKISSSTSYKDVATFGVCLLFLIEIGSNNEVQNSMFIEVNHN